MAALASLSQLKILLSVALSDTSQDAILQQCLDAATQAAQSYTKRPGLVSPPVTYDGTGSNPRPVYLSGTGTDTIRLPHYPVGGSSITIFEDLMGFFGTAPNAFAAAALTEGVDYVLGRDDPTGTYLSLSGIVHRLRSPNLSSVLGVVPGGVPYGTLSGGPAGPTWSRSQGSVKVTFTAGFVAGGVPPDLANAVAEIAAWTKRNGQFGGQEMVASENLGSYGYSVAAAGVGSAPALGSVRQTLSRYRDRPL
jgi:hypothetical protein